MEIENPTTQQSVVQTQRTPVPNSVFYSKIKPVGYATKTSAYRFQPTGFVSNSIGNSDIVRFILSLSTGYADPYSAYISMIIDCSSNPQLQLNNGAPGIAVLQIDNSAQSFISSLIIYKDGKELERIMEYDTIAAIIYDLTSSPTTKFQREQEGCGGMVTGNFDTFESSNFSVVDLPPGPVGASGSASSIAVNKNAWNPRASPYTYGKSLPSAVGGGVDAITFINEYDSSYVQMNSSCVWSIAQSDYSLAPQDPYNAQLNTSTLQSVDTTPLVEDFYSGQNVNAWGVGDSSYTNEYQTWAGPIWSDPTQAPSNYNPNQILQYVVADSLLRTTGAGGNLFTDMNRWTSNNTVAALGNPILPQIGSGFTKPWVQNFCGTSMEARFCNQQVQKAIINGQLQVITNLVNQFCFPLMSGLIGSLIPEQNFKLLPMSALRELIFEFKMSPYAMFSSNNKIARDYKVSKFEIVMEIVELDPVTTMAVEMQIDGEGFYFQSVSWFLGPTYNIAGGNVPGQIQVNLGFDSLKTIVLCFLAGDYSNAPAARKQYRLSMNLTSLQLQIGSKYYPQQPITGQSGTNCGYSSAQTNLYTISGNNSEFYINTLRAFNLLHKLDSPHIYGIGNTAVNFRHWNPLAPIFNGQATITGYPDPKNTGLTVNQVQNGSFQDVQQWTGDVNYYFENSCVGKCVYGFDLEAFNYEDVIGGVNTNIERSPFTINLSYSNPQQNGFDTQWLRQATAYVFCLYDLVVRINRFGVETLGRA